MNSDFSDNTSQEDFSKLFAEEDSFPRLFAAVEVRDWGIAEK